MNEVEMLLHYIKYELNIDYVLFFLVMFILVLAIVIYLVLNKILCKRKQKSNLVQNNKKL